MNEGISIFHKQAARRLERALIWARISLRLRRTAAVLFIGAGWFARAQANFFELTDERASLATAAFVEHARQSHETVLVRERMASQRHIANFDPTEILAVRGITLPELPPDWNVVGGAASRSSLEKAAVSLHTVLRLSEGRLKK